MNQHLSPSQSVELKTSRGRGVLVIDHDPATQELLAAQIASLDVEVITAADGAQALAALAGPNIPDVVVMDVEVPGLTGQALCQRIRTDAALADIYVILMMPSQQTASDTLGTVARPTNPSSASADDYLRKPIESLALRSAVRTALRTQALRRVHARRERRRAIEWLGRVVAHEVRTPLTAAMSSMAYMQSLMNEGNTCSADTVDELRMMLAETHAVLERIGETAERFTGQRALQGHGPVTVGQHGYRAAVERLVTQVNRPVTLTVREDPMRNAAFDMQLMIDAATILLNEAQHYCTGDVLISIALEEGRASFIMEIAGAPKQDPDMILEPRLVAREHGPAQFDPGLSPIETAFAECGGQIFARPTGDCWRFGLILPATSSPAS